MPGTLVPTSPSGARPEPISQLPSDSGALRKLARRLGSTARRDEPLSRHTSYRLGGPVDLFWVARTARQLAEAVEAADELGVPWRVIGSGSNLLVADEGVDGLVVKAATRGFRYAPRGERGDVLLYADAGSILAAVARQATLDGLSGLEWATNVPGTVGASVVNNSGAFGSCVAEHLVEASLHWPGSGVRSVTADELRMDYRTSRLKNGEWSAIVLEACFQVTPGDRLRLRAHLAELQRTRRATQPAGSSVGSIFLNPPGAFAGALIEQAGLKGYRMGEAEVSPLHGNFFVNRGSAQAREVLALIRYVQEHVREAAGIWLEPEIQMIGRWNPRDITTGVVSGRR